MGTGIINTAIKGEMASKKAYDEAVKVMATLNKYAGEIIVNYNISACTDVYLDNREKLKHHYIAFM